MIVDWLLGVVLPMVSNADWALLGIMMTHIWEAYDLTSVMSYEMGIGDDRSIFQAHLESQRVGHCDKTLVVSRPSRDHRCRSAIASKSGWLTVDAIADLQTDS